MKYTKPISFVTFFFLYLSIGYSQTMLYEFKVVENTEGKTMELCIPLEDFNSNFYVPSRVLKKERLVYAKPQIIVINSSWVENCLIINFDIEDSFTEIRNLISKITIYPTNSISITTN